MLSNTSNQYFLNLKQNQVKMIKARGYDTSHEEWILNESSGKKFYKKLYKKYGDYPMRKLMYSEYKKPHSKSLFVYFVGLQGGKQIKVESVRPFIEKMTEEDKNGLLIIDSILSAEASKCLGYVTESKYQIFKEEELTFDLISSINVPKHEIVENPAELKAKLRVTNKGLSIITSNDAVARYYHFMPGQMICVTSESDIDLINNYNNDYCIVV
jgi:DNA-directed RNA polymerase subunit H (RpoH/RPB5)